MPMNKTTHDSMLRTIGKKLMVGATNLKAIEDEIAIPAAEAYCEMFREKLGLSNLSDTEITALVYGNLVIAHNFALKPALRSETSHIEVEHDPWDE